MTDSERVTGLISLNASLEKAVKTLQADDKNEQISRLAYDLGVANDSVAHLTGELAAAREALEEERLSRMELAASTASAAIEDAWNHILGRVRGDREKYLAQISNLQADLICKEDALDELVYGRTLGSVAERLGEKR